MASAMKFNTAGMKIDLTKNAWVKAANTLVLSGALLLAVTCPCETYVVNDPVAFH